MSKTGNDCKDSYGKKVLIDGQHWISLARMERKCGDT